MPKVFRVMKPDPTNINMPKTGSESCCLGVRDNEIDIDGARTVGPGTNHGMSVNASLVSIPPTLVPPQYAKQVEGSAGKRSHNVWTVGQGPFKSGPFATSLQLACSGSDYGVVEPDSRINHSAYRRALADTQPEWKIVEPI